MELVQMSKFREINNCHTITYDSWKQFINCEENLKHIWKDLFPFSWACKKVSNDYTLQLIYIPREPTPVKFGLGEYAKVNENLIEQRIVEVTFTESNVRDIIQWLIQNNPDLWKINTLQQLVSSTPV